MPNISDYITAAIDAIEVDEPTQALEWLRRIQEACSTQDDRGEVIRALIDKHYKPLAECAGDEEWRECLARFGADSYVAGMESSLTQRNPSDYWRARCHELRSRMKQEGPAARTAREKEQSEAFNEPFDPTQG